VPPIQTNLLQGTLDLLILKALALGQLHGLGVSRRIDQITKGTFSVGPGSLFPALHRLEDAGWLVSHWGQSENNRRAKYYKLTRAGTRQLQVETGQWNRVALAISLALEAI
jgi:PadR family transcriptional regulator PadR